MNPLGRVRNQAIDIVRGSAMLLVIYAHALEIFFNPKFRLDHAFNHNAFECWRMIFSFHMPAFYVVAGMAAATHEQGSLKKSLTTALAFLLFAYTTQLIAAPFYVWMNWTDAGAIQLLERTVLPLILGSGFILNVTWFVVSIGFVHVLAWIHSNTRLVGKAILWSSMAALFAVSVVTRHYFYAIQTWGIGLLFFLLGQIRVLQMFPPKKFGGFEYAAASAALFGVVFFLFPLNHGCLFNPTQLCSPWPGTAEFGVNLAGGQIGFLPLFFVTAALGTLALVVFAQALMETAFGAAIAWIGRNTLTLLVVNGATLAFVQPFLGAHIAARSDYVFVFICAALTVAQIALVPLLQVLVDWLYKACRKIAAALLTRVPVAAPIFSGRNS